MLESRPLFTLRIDLHPVQMIGATPLGERRIVPMSGGELVGDRIHGRVLPFAGGDWLLQRRDGALQQDVRLTLETDDGALILMSYRGVRHASPEVSARLARGEEVSPDDYYLRTAPFFETAAERYAWLNLIVAVAKGRRAGGSVIYDVYEIL
jgi:uncharacterized protein DUF3237